MKIKGFPDQVILFALQKKNHSCKLKEKNAGARKQVLHFPVEYPTCCRDDGGAYT
jgi:hypothetical protein